MSSTVKVMLSDAEVTRQAARGATVSDFSNAATMDALRWRAVFRNGPGRLPGAPELSDAAVRIDYLNAALTPVDIGASCPARNVLNCASDPGGSACIRFVRVRLCQPAVGGSCQPLVYRPLAGVLSVLPGGFALELPTAAVVMPAETLGFRPGQSNC